MRAFLKYLKKFLIINYFRLHLSANSSQLHLKLELK